MTDGRIAPKMGPTSSKHSRRSGHGRACKCSSRALRRRSIWRNDRTLAPCPCSGFASHRLEGAIELDVDQQRATALDPLGDEIRRLVNGLRPLRLDAE